MANASIEKQVDTTVKVLVTLLAEPRISAAQLAKVTEQSPGNIARLIGRFREAGLLIDYDFSEERYKVALGEKIKKSLLGRYGKQLARLLNAAAKGRQEIKFVQELERYSIDEFADAFGYGTGQNVYNMIIGYKGQELPKGWVAFQTQERCKWYIQKMPRNRDGKTYHLPPDAKSAFRYTIGTGDEPGKKADQEARMQCNVVTCDYKPVSRGLCKVHYYMSRRNERKFQTLKLRAVR